MEQGLHIDAITPEILDWTCKVQLVDICRPGEDRERKIKYMNMIFPDEQQNQVKKAIVYGDYTPLYKHRFRSFHTYLIKNTQVHQSTLRYERSFHAYEWIVDKETTIDSIDYNNSDQTIVDPFHPDGLDEDELPLPTIVTWAHFGISMKKHPKALKSNSRMQNS